MFRLLTAAALAALLAAPAMAQSVSPGDNPNSTIQNQGGSGVPGSSSSGSMSGSTGLSEQMPADCAPNDPRPSCQTAQIPGEPGSSATNPAIPPSQRQGSGAWDGSSGSGSSGSGSSGSSSGSMGR